MQLGLPSPVGPLVQAPCNGESTGSCRERNGETPLLLGPLLIKKKKKQNKRLIHRHSLGTTLCHHRGEMGGCPSPPSSAWMLGFPFHQGSPGYSSRSESPLYDLLRAPWCAAGKLWPRSEDTCPASTLPWGEALPASRASTLRPPPRGSRPVGAPPALVQKGRACSHLPCEGSALLNFKELGPCVIVPVVLVKGFLAPSGRGVSHSPHPSPRPWGIAG